MASRLKPISPAMLRGPLLTSSHNVAKRLSSTSSGSSPGTTTYTMRPLPPKAHLHRPLEAETLPRGFLVGGLHVGVKKSVALSSTDKTNLTPSGPPDVSLFMSTTPIPQNATAALFTANSVRAAPVIVSETILEKMRGKVRSVVVNSGCANAVTGEKGMENAWSMSKAAGAAVGAGEEALVMSTGVIGQHLPIEKILQGIERLKESLSAASNSVSSLLGSTPSHYDAASRGLLTTDTFPKLRSRIFTLGGKEYRIAGMDKGAGMIHPRMVSPPFSPNGTTASTDWEGLLKSGKSLHATLLGIILTDVRITPSSLQIALDYAVQRSFNSISVDGEMSTNDTIICMASGAGGTLPLSSAARPTEVKNPDDAPSAATQTVSQSQAFSKAAEQDELEIDEKRTPELYNAFRSELTSFAIELAQLVVRDGEGATKFVSIRVKGAPTYADAHAAASRIATSALVKTALYGEDANWGRILSAIGSLSTLSRPLDPTKLSVTLVPVNVPTQKAAQGLPEITLLENGEPQPFSEATAKQILQREDLAFVVDMGLSEGPEGDATFWTCDFSYEYVRINGDYRS